MATLRHSYLTLLLLLATLIPSCQIVDVQPFTTATKDMGAAVDASMHQVLANINQAGEVFIPATDSQKTRWNRYRTQLDSGAVKFRRVAHAYDAYAKALEAVSVDGKAHEDKIKAVFETTEKIANAAEDFVGPFVGPYGAFFTKAIGVLRESVERLNSLKTNSKLKDLASAQQDSVIQQSARLLRAGLQEYAIADAAVFNLLLDNDPIHNKIMLSQRAAQRLSSNVAERVLTLAEADNSLMNQPTAPGLLDGSDSYIHKLEMMGADGDHRIRKAFEALKNKPTLANSDILRKALQTRKQEYLNLIDNRLGQALADAEDKRWNNIYTIPQQKSKEQFDKSQAAIKAWAKAHHELRQLLLKAGKVTRQDLVDQAKDVQKVISELKDAKEAAAKAAKEAADKAKADAK